jgi:hypothetical protein
MMNWKPSALPPSNGTPSTLPSKSIVTRSPTVAGSAAGRCAKVRRCLRRISSVLSIASSVTSVDARSTSAVPRSPSWTSG